MIFKLARLRYRKIIKKQLKIINHPLTSGPCLGFSLFAGSGGGVKIENMFKIGMKVVCIENFEGIDLWGKKPYEKMPVKNSIYTFDGDAPMDGIFLKEFTNKSPQGRGRICFVAYKFRPLNETFAESVLTNIAEQIEQEQLIEAI